jgi:hypothetical protein
MAGLWPWQPNAHLGCHEQEFQENYHKCKSKSNFALLWGRVNAYVTNGLKKLKKKKHVIVVTEKRNIYISRRILHQHWYTCPIVLPVRRNLQHRSLFDYCLSHFRTWPGIVCDFRTSLTEFVDPVVNRFKRQTLPTVNRIYFFMNILCIESFCLPPKSAKQNSVPRLLWSWTVLLPSDTHRKPITSITAVLLPFTNYLLSLPRIIGW